MLNLKSMRTGLVATVLAGLALSIGASSHLLKNNFAVLPVVNAELGSITTSSAPPVRSTTYFLVRPDLRRCASPLCGGYFVKTVNATRTRCGDGRSRPECYVANIDWRGESQPEGRQMLVRGNIVARSYKGFGNLGELRVSESWRALGSKQPAGTFYLIRDRGVRCIAFPCPTHSETKLNSSFKRNIAGVKLDDAGLGADAIDSANTAMTAPDGLIASGADVPVTGPGGKSFELRATQAYVRNRKTVTGMKPCFKTGCGNQICSDHTVISTCEYRPEFECYKRATCERQTDGNCAFTKTPELTECLAKK